MLTAANIANARNLQVTTTAVSVPDTTAVALVRGDANRMKVRVTIAPAAAYTVDQAPALAFYNNGGFVRLHSFGVDELSVELCALEYGAVVFGPLYGIGSAAGAVGFYVTSIALNQEPIE